MARINLLRACWAFFLVPAAVNAVPHQRHARFHNARDAGSQPICVPISPILTDAEDLAAKIRPDPGVCPVADEVLAPVAQIAPLSASSRMAITGLDDDPYSCNENNPCKNGACCSRLGVCGYGPTYCGDNNKSPNDSCWSNCDAKAECGRYSDPPGTQCPLNVCCSQYGFCGMTEEFCTVTDNDETSCQSNCEQPGSGSSGGDVQQRIIGYYESWNHNKRCIGMPIDDIPVESLTHIYYAFAYIRPETYEIVVMEDDKGKYVPADTFRDFTALKKKNPAIKATIALGGWTFNDNGTYWQPVFSKMVSSEKNRSTFIKNLLKFMRTYGFDGVDIDWEYPGAGDRGGHPEDGVNFTKLLKEMRVAFVATSALNILFGKSAYEISFTAPTSYWYLRHFDLAASVKSVDYINVMSYDLHGIWDRDNPIGSQVLPHTNLTEIKSALDLLWRNDVPPAKVNLGLGFYGRSFELADPACAVPGCLFKGGAAKGPCTDNSGTLSYQEIMDIMNTHNLKPTYDKESAVKWISWNTNQWVSYDDQNTFQQKIQLANKLGIGGLLIWAIDLDNVQLDALSAVIYPKRLGAFAKVSGDSANWQDVSEGWCYATECGKKTCKPGYIPVETTQCSNTVLRHTNKHQTTTLCCPFASAPNPDKCTWRGTEKGGWCNGRCHDGEVAVQSSYWGDGGRCTDGRKFYCCESETIKPDCRWTGCGDDDENVCTSEENELTWMWSTCKSGKWKRLCCAKQQEWTNCAWHGKPGSCFDNHCDTGYQVSLTTEYEGEGHNCGVHLARHRSFCCDPPDGESPFLPVPLDYLFEDPPQNNQVDVEYELKVDPTWGGQRGSRIDAEPDEAPFGFVVMVSPEEIQVSLDKRDGSHWEVFDCFDSTTEGVHTVRMVCSDLSDTSNCPKIHLGHGVPGTILQMPAGCGPGKYAVAQSLHPSENQTLPGHLARRDLVDTVYDLTFDYDFRRVPRDLGDTLLRIDYSNDPNYWDGIVDKAASNTKRHKRSMADVAGNHRRWLEEEFRDDLHFGGLAHEDLHKRWFGKDILDWLRRQIGIVEKTVEYAHTYSEDFTLKIIDEHLTCPNMEAILDIYTQAHVEASVNYGFTLITKLEWPIDLSDSYLYFRTRGEVTARFVTDAAVRLFFDTGDVLLFSADKFGATFSVPGVVTIGPNFKLFGQLEGSATLGVNFESMVQLAEWDVQQTYPVPNDDWVPKATRSPDKDKTKSLLDPTFDWGLTLEGHVSAHIKPTITFGIEWNQDLIPLGSCAVNLIADGHITFYADGRIDGTGATFCYGVDAGADLYATIDAPDALSWALPDSPFPIMPIDDVQIVPRQCWIPGTKQSSRRDSMRRGVNEELPQNSSLVLPDEPYHSQGNTIVLPNKLATRDRVYGPLLPYMPGLRCPGDTDDDDADGIECPACATNFAPGSSATKRGLLGSRDDAAIGSLCPYDPVTADEEPVCPLDSSLETRSLEKRFSSDDKKLQWPSKNFKKPYSVVKYPNCGVALDLPTIDRFYSVNPIACSPAVTKRATAPSPPPGEPPLKWVTEHVYEFNAVKMFLEFLCQFDSNTNSDFKQKPPPLPPGYGPATVEWVAAVILTLGSPDLPTVQTLQIGGRTVEELLYSFIGNSGYLNAMVITERKLNREKETVLKLENLSPAVTTLKGALPEENMMQAMYYHRNRASVFSYMQIDDIWDRFKASSKGIEDVWDQFDQAYALVGPIKGEPTLPAPAKGQAQQKLRSLYCYWIDVTLAQMEAKAKSWHSTAVTNFENKFAKVAPPGYSGVRKLFNPGQPLAESTLKFPATLAGRHPGPNSKTPVQWDKSNYKDLWKGGPIGPF